jgi:hypothetical protein
LRLFERQVTHSLHIVEWLPPRHRYLEEAAAESIATRSLRKGLRFPVAGKYGISLGRVAVEAVTYVGGSAGAAYQLDLER